MTEASYLAVENAYLFAIEAFLTESRVTPLWLRGLEDRPNHPLPAWATTGEPLDHRHCVAFARLALREQAWGRLVAPGRAYLHFEYDFYMYMGLPRVCREAIAQVLSRGLYVEPCRSPYLRTHSTGALSKPARKVEA